MSGQELVRQSDRDPSPALRGSGFQRGATLNQMQTHDSVDAMVISYAEQAVQQGRDSKAQLDFSENSLMEVESILAQLARQMAEAKQLADDVGEVCKVWGSYLGEV